MNLDSIQEGDIIQFVTRVNSSSENQPIQNVMLKVTEITGTKITGVNALRTLNSNDGVVFRSYHRSNIVGGTVWKMIA